MKYHTSTTEFNCGIDLHAREMYICVMDREGNILVHTNIKDNDFGFFLKRIEPYACCISGSLSSNMNTGSLMACCVWPNVTNHRFSTCGAG